MFLSFVNLFSLKKKIRKLHCNIGYQHVTSPTGNELNKGEKKEIQQREK